MTTKTFRFIDEAAKIEFARGSDSNEKIANTLGMQPFEGDIQANGEINKVYLNGAKACEGFSPVFRASEVRKYLKETEAVVKVPVKEFTDWLYDNNYIRETSDVMIARFDEYKKAKKREVQGKIKALEDEIKNLREMIEE